MESAALLDAARPHRVGTAPAAFSTCVEVQRWPVAAADPNGYYRELGVHPHASRRELREAYERLGGWCSGRLTYVLLQLLDRAVRRRYDAMPPGDPMPDQYVADDLARLANLRKSRLLYEYRDDPRGLVRYLDDNDLEMFGDGASLSLSVLDDILQNRQDEPATQAVYPYGHYLWRTSAADPHRLARWQEYLVREAALRGLTLILAVGLHGLEPDWLCVQVGYLGVAFLRYDAEPDRKAAYGAIESLLSQRPHPAWRTAREH